MKPSADPVLQWLLAGDPSIRWQVMCDLQRTPQRTVNSERQRIATEGWGAQLLALQDPAGTWAGGQSGDGGLYTPKWISTHYTMMLLRDLGLPPDNPQAQRACAQLLEGGIRPDGGVRYILSAKHLGTGETCVTGMALSLFAYFAYDDERVDVIAEHLLREQMDDGGWNCRRPRGATHSSFHTTISALEGLWLYGEQRTPNRKAVRAAQQAGREFLLQHRLFRSHRTGNIVKTEFTRFAFPPRWHYDILRALDYFRAVNAPRDPRLADAMQYVYDTRRSDGCWTLQNTYHGKVYFDMERRGKPSRWNTLRALRVLKWWEAGKRSRA